MAIITTPVAAPQSTSDAPSPSAQSARARALALLTPQAPATQEQTSVTPEEAQAVKPAPETLLDGQKVKTDSPLESKEATPDKEEPLSSQFAVLARKEKALRVKAQQQEAAIKAREDAIATREAALLAKDTEYQSNYIPKSKLLEDTLGTLSEAGIDYEQLTQLALNPPPKQDPATKAYIAKLEAQINKINGTLEQQQKTAVESQTQAYQTAIKQITTDVTKLVSAGDDFETIRSTGAAKEVVRLIEKTYQEDGYVMDYAQACKEVEDHLVEEYSKLSQLKKIQARLNGNKPAVDPKTQQTPSESPKQTQQIKTLTNAVGVSRQLSARERAILAMKGELK